MSKLDKYNLNQIKELDRKSLSDLCSDIKDFLTDLIPSIGGHFGGNLGVIELTVALHYMFNSPEDKIIWDIGHQSYVHKMLTGRVSKMDTIRQKNGISGFCSISESKHDIFGAGHSSTSISAGLGFAVYNNINKKNDWVVCVIGDGAMGAGMSFEALNNVPKSGRLIIILNDNGMSICPSVGNLSKHLDGIDPKSNIFTSLGLNYIGVIDGHNLDNLIDVIDEVKKNHNSPVLIHIKTNKGNGCQTENIRDKLHSVSPCEESQKNCTYTNIASKKLEGIMSNNPDAVIVTPAMMIGSDLLEIEKKYPDRVFDVGIAEQHALTFCGGMAAAGLKSFCAIYSTFLQRGYDQVVHDIAIQNLPVKILIDRSGFVGNDGPTHHGSFDISMLTPLPNFVLMAPSNEQDLLGMMDLSLTINAPCAIRYPKEKVSKYINKEKISLGKGSLILKGKDVCILNYGSLLSNVLDAHDLLKDKGINITVCDMRFAKPIDREMICSISTEHNHIITIEDGSIIGGFGNVVTNELNNIGFKGKVTTLGHKDITMEQMSRSDQIKESGLDAKSIAKIVSQLC